MSEDTKLVDAINRIRAELKRLDKENTVMRSVLNEIAEPYDCKWYKSAHDGDDVVDAMIAMARMALNKAGGEGISEPKIYKGIASEEQLTAEIDRLNRELEEASTIANNNYEVILKCNRQINDLNCNVRTYEGIPSR